MYATNSVYITLGPAVVFLWLVLFASEDHKFFSPLLRNHLFPPENLAHIISHRGQTRHAPRNSQIFPFLSSRSIFRTHGASFVSILCIIYLFFHNSQASHLLFSLCRELESLGWIYLTTMSLISYSYERNEKVNPRPAIYIESLRLNKHIGLTFILQHHDI